MLDTHLEHSLAGEWDDSLVCCDPFLLPCSWGEGYRLGSRRHVDPNDTVMLLLLQAAAAAPSEGDDAARGMRPGGSIKGNIGKYYDSLFTVEKHRMHSEEVEAM